MKRLILLPMAFVLASVITFADDKPIKKDQLPQAAITFLNDNFASHEILYATKDDDIFYPDFNVALTNGVELEFYNNGALKKIESRNGVPADLIPVQIVKFVKSRYPDAIFVEYEVDRKHYEAKLSNGLELKFNTNFNVIEIDD